MMEENNYFLSLPRSNVVMQLFGGVYYTDNDP